MMDATSADPIALAFRTTGGRQAGRAHWFGLGVFGGAVRLIMVLQLRHENVSNCALFSSDLLLSIASLQSGQFRIGGRGGAGIRATI